MPTLTRLKTPALVVILCHLAFAPLGQAAAGLYCAKGSLSGERNRRAVAEELTRSFMALGRDATVPPGSLKATFLDDSRSGFVGPKFRCEVTLQEKRRNESLKQEVDTRLLYVTSAAVEIPPGSKNSLTLRMKVGEDPSVDEITCQVSEARELGEVIDALNRKLRLVHEPTQPRPRLEAAEQCADWPDDAPAATAIATEAATPAPAQEFEALVDRSCANCHKDGEGDQGGFGTLKDTGVLVAKGIVVPGDAQASLLHRKVRDGDMPPSAPLKDEDKAVVERWIQSLPGAKPPSTLIKNQEVVEAVLADLKKQPKIAQPFMRYFRIDGLINAGVPADKIAEYKESLGKLVNGLSWKKTIYLPEEADPKGRFLRVDLRKLGWSQAVWEKIQKADPFKFTDGGKDGATLVASLKELQKTSASGDPVARADWFLANGSKPPLYHDILGMPQTLGELERTLGVDTRKSGREGDAARSGFANSGVSQNNRIIERYDSLYGAYWKSLDYANNDGRQNIFKHPLDSNPAGGEVIFHLPNGSLAYVLADGQGRRINKAPVDIVSDPGRPDRTVENGISCFSCHATGLIPKDDEIRAIAEAEFAGKTFSGKDLEIIRALHVKPEELRAMVGRDSKQYQDALGRISERSRGQDLLTPLINGYERPVSLASAAADFGVEPARLVEAIQAAIGQVAELGPLVTGNCEIPRDIYEKNFSKLDSFLTGGKAVRSGVENANQLVAGTYVGRFANKACNSSAIVSNVVNKGGRTVSFTIDVPNSNGSHFSLDRVCQPGGFCVNAVGVKGNYTVQIRADESLFIKDPNQDPAQNCTGTVRLRR